MLAFDEPLGYRGPLNNCLPDDDIYFYLIAAFRADLDPSRGGKIRYGTLPDHAGSGEERFLVEWDRQDGSVCYDILAFSRPRHLLARLGYPWVRHRHGRHGRPPGRRPAADRLTNAIVLLRFEDGALGQSELSWTARGSLDLRNEVYGTEGSIFTDVTRATPIHAFVRTTGSYLLEKAESTSGWIFPLPDEARVYGYHEEMKHFVACVARGEMPRETFEDGVVVNVIVDAAYQSMREHRWVPLDLP